jgi:NAD(P)-dependent dehydrogenase (short-subunit alcohol dehydrogenase family)
VDPAGQQLQGKRIILIGGARGMGKAAVRAFALEGASVALLDREAELGEQVANDATGMSGGKVQFRQADVSRRDDLASAFEWAAGWLGGLDALVDTAAIQVDSPAETVSDEEWDLQFAINARGTFISNQLAFPHLRAHGGRIINFGSGAGVAGMPGAGAYAATKGAVLAWTRTIAREWGRYNITANAVVPAIWTPMYEEHRARMTPDELAEMEARHAQQIPLGGKLGDPDRDFAPVLVFLVSDGSRFITGQTICVDGGKLMLT